MENNKSITSSDFENSFSDQLKSTSKDLFTDYLEVGIDSFLTVGEDLPLVKTLTSLYNIHKSYRERQFAKNLFSFLSEYEQKKESKEETDTFISNFETKEDYRERVIKHLLLFLDRHITETKSKILANLFLSYISGVITWDTFQRLSKILDSIILDNMTFIYHMSFFERTNYAKIRSSTNYGTNIYAGGQKKEGFKNSFEMRKEDVQVLIAIGMVIESNKSVSVTKLGEMFFKLGRIKELFDHNEINKLPPR